MWKKFLTSSWESVTSRLYPILSDELLRCFDGSDFTGTDIITSKHPYTVYLRLPEAELLALAPVVRLLFQSLINTCITTYDRRPGRTAAEKGCYPVLFLIDEAGRAKIPQLYDYATTVVGRQMSLWVAIQSIVQLEAIYGWANAQVFLDNMDSQIFYRQTKATAKYLEDELGKKSEYSRSASRAADSLTITSSKSASMKAIGRGVAVQSGTNSMAFNSLDGLPAATISDGTACFAKTSGCSSRWKMNWRWMRSHSIRSRAISPRFTGPKSSTWRYVPAVQGGFAQ
jgi:type IV secretory system conjugative DNA transfer VirD4/TraG family protein